MVVQLESNHRDTQVYPWAEQYVGIYRSDTLIYGDAISQKDEQIIKISQLNPIYHYTMYL